MGDSQGVAILEWLSYKPNGKKHIHLSKGNQEVRMKKWIIMAAANWLRKPENQQKAKSAWSKFRNRNSSKRTTPPTQDTTRNTTNRRPGENLDGRP